jgi:hemerythrin-like domain-containing protein
MEAIRSLIVEHQQIGHLVDALEVYARRTKLGQSDEAPCLAEFAAVFIELGECMHHEKEEGILLPTLVRHGVRWDEGALPAVRREHRQEAYLIDVLRQAGERATSWNDEDRRHIAAAAQALVEFQRNHHALESTHVFPLVDQRLSVEERATLQAALERFDLAHAEQREAALLRLQALVARYAPATHSGVQALLSGVGDPSESRRGVHQAGFFSSNSASCSGTSVKR